MIALTSNDKIIRIKFQKNAYIFKNKHISSIVKKIERIAKNDNEKFKRIRCQKFEDNASNWLEFAFPENSGFTDESDPALKSALNEISNMCLKAMLDDDSDRVSELKEELFTLGEFFSNKGNNDAALFVYVLYEMTQHRIPIQVDNLKGLYNDAFLKVAGILEDSGWQLTQENNEEQQNKDNETVNML